MKIIKTKDTLNALLIGKTITESLPLAEKSKWNKNLTSSVSDKLFINQNDIHKFIDLI